MLLIVGSEVLREALARVYATCTANHSCWIEAEKLAPILGCLGRVEPVAQPATTRKQWWPVFVLRIKGGTSRGGERGGAALPGYAARGRGPVRHRHRPRGKHPLLEQSRRRDLRLVLGGGAG